jgi:hypothetical protein
VLKVDCPGSDGVAALRVSIASEAFPRLTASLARRVSRKLNGTMVSSGNLLASSSVSACARLSSPAYARASAAPYCTSRGAHRPGPRDKHWRAAHLSSEANRQRSRQRECCSCRTRRSSADRKVVLTENVRRQLQRLLCIRLPEAVPAGAP